MRWQGVPCCGKELSPPPLSESGRAAALAMGSLVLYWCSRRREVYSSSSSTSLVLILDFQTREGGAEPSCCINGLLALACALCLRQTTGRAEG